MATKIYLPSSGSAPVAPSTWNIPNQINPLTFAGVISKINSAMTSKTEATGTTSPTYRAMLRYVIGPLTATQISGTVHLQMRAQESNAGANATFCIAVKIIKPDGTDRAVLLAYTGADSATSPYEFLTALTNRRAYNTSETQPISLTSQTPTAGDYLVIEIGFRSATTTSRNITLRYGDTTTADMEDNTTSTNDYAPWVEFSADIPFPQTRELVANISGASVTPDVLGSILRELLANIAAGSVVPDISITTTRDLQTLIAAISSTPDIAVPRMSLDFEFLDTQDVEFIDTQHVEFLKESEGEIRELVATIVASSSTPDAAATIARALQAAISATSFVGGPNLLTNEGMEEGNPPTGWEAVNTPETFERSAVEKHSGNYSAHIVDSTPSYGGMRKWFTFLPNRTYKISFWYKQLANRCHLGLWDGAAAPSLKSCESTLNEWLYYEDIFNSSADAGVGYIDLYNISNTIAAEFHIDDVSVRGDVSAAISRALSASIIAGSITPDIAAIMARALIAIIAVSTSTPDAAATTIRALLAAIAAGTLTLDVAATITRSILANISAASTAPDISQTIARALLATVSASSLTPEISITIARALTAGIIASSYTPDITITIQGLVNLIANITGSSITPDVAPTVMRSLIASIPSQSATADAIASITRNLIANIAAASVVPDITATVENVINLSAAIAGASITPDVSAAIARSLIGLITAESITPDVQAAVARALIANIQGTSVTPDDLILILAGLGIILDPGIVSVTPRRIYNSITPERIYQSVTPARTIENM